MVFCSAATYEGQWEHDLMHGKGVMIEANREKYDGFFVMNQRDGQGVWTSPNGAMYEGLWKAGRREGLGKQKYSDGSVYEGMFSNDKVSDPSSFCPNFFSDPFYHSATERAPGRVWEITTTRATGLMTRRRARAP